MAKKTQSRAPGGQLTPKELSQVLTDMGPLVARLALHGRRRLPSLTPDERQHTSGKLKADEKKALDAVLKGVKLRPALFKDIERKLGLTAGESELDLASLGVLGSIVTDLQGITQHAQDAVLFAAARVKRFTAPVYAEEKRRADSDDGLKGTVAPAISFYGEAAAQKKTNERRKNKKAKGNDSSAGSGT
jgi:hypothetical protein